MKSLIYVIFAFCLINFNTYANKVLSFDASKIINYNNSISNELIDEESIVLYNLNTISGKINYSAIQYKIIEQ